MLRPTAPLDQAGKIIAVCVLCEAVVDGVKNFLMQSATVDDRGAVQFDMGGLFGAVPGLGNVLELPQDSWRAICRKQCF